MMLLKLSFNGVKLNGFLLRLLIFPLKLDDVDGLEREEHAVEGGAEERERREAIFGIGRVMK